MPSRLPQQPSPPPLEQPIELRFQSMHTDDIVHVDEIARASFPTPWSAKTFWREIEQNEQGFYWVLQPQLQQAGSSLNPVLPAVLAYGGYWAMDEEAHIVTVATHQEWRRCGLGKLLLLNILLAAYQAGIKTLSLEVRESNVAARYLYASLGFMEEGRRIEYYSINRNSPEREDALILTLFEIDPVTIQQQLEHQKSMTEAQIRQSTSNC